MISLSVRGWSPLVLVVTLMSVGCESPPNPRPAPGVRSTFEGAVQEFSGPGVLVVVTWAEWASMWKLLEPELLEFQAQVPASVVFRIVNVDEEPDVARQLGATIVPSVVIVKDGAAVEVLPNLTSAQDLSRVVSKWLDT